MKRCVVCLKRIPWRLPLCARHYEAFTKQSRLSLVEWAAHRARLAERRRWRKKRRR